MWKILLCHDGSAEATRAAEEFLATLEDPADLTIFHVLEPVPPQLLEHRGSERPHEEERIEARLRERRRNWIRDKLAETNRAFRSVLHRLRDAGNPENRITLKLFPAYDDDDFFLFLKEETGSGEYDRVLVVHHSRTWLGGLLTRSTADRVQKELEDLDVEVQVVEA